MYVKYVLSLYILRYSVCLEHELIFICLLLVTDKKILLHLDNEKEKQKAQNSFTRTLGVWN